MLFETKPGVGDAGGDRWRLGTALQTPLIAGRLDARGPGQPCVLAEPPKGAQGLARAEGRHQAVYTRMLK